MLEQLSFHKYLNFTATHVPSIIPIKKKKKNFLHASFFLLQKKNTDIHRIEWTKKRNFRKVWATSGQKKGVASVRGEEKIRGFRALNRYSIRSRVKKAVGLRATWRTLREGGGHANHPDRFWIQKETMEISPGLLKTCEESVRPLPPNKTLSFSTFLSMYFVHRI